MTLPRAEPFEIYQRVSSKLSKSKKVYTAQAVCWLMIQQCLEELSMEEVLHKARAEELKSLYGDCKRAKGKLSKNTSAYSQARKELPLEIWLPLFEELFFLLNEKSIHWQGRPAIILDGTTLTLQPTAELRKAYPPGSNQYGQHSHPEMLVAVAHDLNSGLAYPPKFGAKTGKDAVSEISLGIELIGDFEKDTIIVADRGFGIFQVAFAAVKSSKDIVFRLTKERAQSLMRRCSIDVNAQESALTWTPSPYELNHYPELCKEDQITGRLIVRSIIKPGKPAEELYLFTTLKEDAQDLLELYARRWEIETDIRNIKVTCKLDQLSSLGEEMVEKELFAGIFSYNLVRAAMLLIGHEFNVDPRRIKFKLTKTVIKYLAPIVAESSTNSERSNLLWEAFEALAKNTNKKRNRPPQPRKQYKKRANFPPRKPLQNS
jgi:hypothetical protein